MNFQPKNDSSSTTPNPKQELREKVRSLENKLNNMNVNEIMDMVTVEYSDLEQLVSDTVNKVLDEVESKQESRWSRTETYKTDQCIPLSAIQQARKEWE